MKIQKYLLIVSALLVAHIAFSQKKPTEAITDPTRNVELVIPDDFSSSLDLLLQNWAIDRLASKGDCVSKPNPPTGEEDYRARLKKLPHIVDMPYNESVKSFIEIYTLQRRRQVEYMLGLSEYYFPIFEEELEKLGLPLELKYLPIIESSLNPRAVSRAGATGIWQFMLATGRAYGLEINSLVDERMDSRKASRAAAHYFRDLYKIYEDWHLAIAAYNCGPGNVNKAINRAGGKRDFWEIYPFLPAETRAYLPIFIAANYVMSYPKEHNLCTAKSRLPLLTDTLMVTQRVHLEQIADVLELPIEEVQLLNPQYRKDIIPGDIKAYPLCLPLNYANLYLKRQEEIFAYKKEELIDNRKEEVSVPQTKPTAPRPQGKFVYHTVRKGQNLGSIANKYGTTVKKIQNANGLRSTKIQPGQRLKIPK